MPEKRAHSTNKLSMARVACLAVDLMDTPYKKPRLAAHCRQQAMYCVEISDFELVVIAKCWHAGCYCQQLIFLNIPVTCSKPRQKLPSSLSR